MKKILVLIFSFICACSYSQYGTRISTDTLRAEYIKPLNGMLHINFPDGSSLNSASNLGTVTSVGSTNTNGISWTITNPTTMPNLFFRWDSINWFVTQNQRRLDSLRRNTLLNLKANKSDTSTYIVTPHYLSTHIAGDDSVKMLSKYQSSQIYQPLLPFYIGSTYPPGGGEGTNPLWVSTHSLGAQTMITDFLNIISFSNPSLNVNINPWNISMGNGTMLPLNLQPYTTSVTDVSGFRNYIFSSANKVHYGKIFSVRDSTTEVFTIDPSGNINIPTGANYEINGVPISSSGSSITLTTNNTSGAASLTGTTLNIPNYSAPNYLAMPGTYKIPFRTQNTVIPLINVSSNLVILPDTVGAVPGNYGHGQFKTDGTHTVIFGSPFVSASGNSALDSLKASPANVVYTYVWQCLGTSTNRIYIYSLAAPLTTTATTQMTFTQILDSISNWQTFASPYKINFRRSRLEFPVPISLVGLSNTIVPIAADTINAVDQAGGILTVYGTTGDYLYFSQPWTLDSVSINSNGGQFLRTFGTTTNMKYNFFAVCSGYGINREYTIAIKDSIPFIPPTIHVTGISVSPSTASINMVQTQQLTTTITPSNASNQAVNYTTGNSAIATVSSGGLITPVGLGTTNITGTTVDGGFTSSCSTTVGAYTFNAPGTFTATGTSSSTIQVTWTVPSYNTNATHFELDSCSTSGGTYIAISTTIPNTNTSYNVTGLHANHTTYFKMRTLGNGTTFLTSAFTSVQNATTNNTTQLAALTLNTPTVVSSTGINVTSVANISNNSGYDWKYSVSPYTSWTDFGNTSTNINSENFTGLSPATAYEFEAITLGTGAYSNSTPSSAVGPSTTWGTAPTLTSAYTDASNGDTIHLVFSKAMQSSPSSTGITFSPSNTISSITMHSTNSAMYDLVLGTANTNGTTITVSYSPGTIVANDLGVLASFSGVSVTNNVPSSGSSTAAIESIANIASLWIAEKNSDFTFVSDSAVATWKSRVGTNVYMQYHTTGDYYHFDISQKKVHNITNGIGASTYYNFNNFPNLGSGDFTIIIYEHFNLPNTDAYILNGGYSRPALDLTSIYGYGIYYDSNSTLFAPATNTGVRKLILTRTGSTLTLEVNGTVYSPYYNSATSANIYNIQATGQQANNIGGDIFAIVIFQRVLTSGEQTTVKTTLNTILGL